MKSFKEEMQKSKERSKKSWKASSQVDQSEYFSIFESFGPTKFCGYENLESTGKLIKILPINSHEDMLFLRKHHFMANQEDNLEILVLWMIMCLSWM